MQASDMNGKYRYIQQCNWSTNHTEWRVLDTWISLAIITVIHQILSVLYYTNRRSVLWTSYRKTFCLQQEGIYLYLHIAAVRCDPSDSYKLYTHVIPHLCLHLLSYSWGSSRVGTWQSFIQSWNLQCESVLYFVTINSKCLLSMAADFE